MALDPLAVLYTGLFLAVVCGLYGLLIAILWSPFLLSERIRALFSALPPADWRASYALWIPVPATVWGFLFGSVLSLSRDVRPPADASSLYVGGIDGIAVATALVLVSLPVLSLRVLPARGTGRDPADDTPRTVLLVLAGTVWYLLLLVGPAYALTVLAGFGDAMSGP